MRRQKDKGFTLMEIMIVVMIIGILLAIAVPNFIRARATARLKAIESNLKQIDSAVQQYAIEQQKSMGNPVTQAQLDGSGGSMNYLKWPVGPVVGTYAVSDVGTHATFDGGSAGALDVLTWDSATCGTPIRSTCWYL